MRIRLHPLDRLIQILQGQRSIYAALLALYRQYHSAMDDWDLVALQPLFTTEQKLLRELNLLERRRLSAIGQFAREVGITADHPRGPEPFGGDVVLPTETNRTISHQQILEYLRDQPSADLRAKHAVLDRLGRDIAKDMAQIEEARQPLLPALEKALAFLERHDPDPSRSSRKAPRDGSQEVEPPERSAYGRASRSGGYRSQTPSSRLDKKV